MSYRLWTIVAVLAAFSMAAWKVELQLLFSAFQPATVALSIMAAAVLVRLNRGMPTLDWKSLEPAGRKRLTAKIVELQKEYLSLLTINTALVGGLLYLEIVTPATIGCWAEWKRSAMSGVLVGGMTLVLARMALVVWRDYDIVKLQKMLIDSAADKELQDAQEAAASGAIAAMRGELKKVDQPKIREWDDKTPPKG